MTSGSNMFLARTLKSAFNSLLLAYATTALLSLPSVLGLAFDLLPSVLYVPAVLVAVAAFTVVESCKYVRTNAGTATRFDRIAVGLSLRTCCLAALCAVSAWLLSAANPLRRNDTAVRSPLDAGCAAAGALFHYEYVYFKRDFHFPIIQTTKYSMFTSKLAEIAWDATNKSFPYTFLVFVTLYAIEPQSCCDFYFVATLWLSVTLLLYLFYSFEHIVYLNMTERTVFPIVTANKDGNCLLNILSSNNKIIKSLALYDLYLATVRDAKRRKEIFSLSFAGNVPQSWKTIFRFCMSNIVSTTEDMTSSVKHASPKPVRRRNVPNARLLKMNGIGNCRQGEENVIKQSMLLVFFEKFRLYNYLFGPLDKEKSLEESEITVWCCYILSNLAVVSLEEDEYGIVREQLGEIISAILELKNQLELQRKTLDQQKIRNLEYLKLHVKTCAIMLALHFAAYADDIGLDETQLQNFKKVITLLKCC